MSTDKSIPAGASGATKQRRKRRKAKKRTVLPETVIRRARDTSALVSSIQVHKADVAAAIERRFSPALRDGETQPDHQLTLELAGRSVQLACDRLEDLDHAYFSARGDRILLTAEVDRVVKKELYPKFVEVRRQINAAYGRKAASELHTVTGRTPRTAALLKLHTKSAIISLGQSNSAPSSRHIIAGEPVDHETWKRRLEKPYAKLTDLERQLSRRRAEVNTLSHRREQAKEHFDAVYAETYGLVKAAFLLAGAGQQTIKSLHPYMRRRRMASRARKEREARAAAPASAGGAETPPAETPPAEAPPTEERRRTFKGAVATAWGWLKKSRAL